MTFTRPTRPTRSGHGTPPLRPAQAPSLEQRMAAKFLSRALPSMSEDERFLFEERVAICMFDGGLSESDAMRVALNDHVLRRSSREIPR